MKKQAFTPLFVSLARLGRRAIPLITDKAIPWTARTGKGVAIPTIKFVKKYPKLSMTAGFAPLSMPRYSAKANQPLGSMPRELPSAYKTSSEKIYKTKYPSIFYKLDDFKKMATVSENARILIKKAGLFQFFTNTGRRSFDEEINKSIVNRIDKIRTDLDNEFAGLGKFEKEGPVSVDNPKSLTEKELKEWHEYRKRKDPSSSRPVKELEKEYLNKVKNDRFVNRIEREISDIKQVSKAVYPKDPFFKALGSSWSKISPVGKIFLAASPIIAASYGGYKLYKSRADKAEISNAFRQMMQIYPDLAKEDINKIRQYYNYIKTYSPTVAKNPHAAGSLIKRFIHSGGMLIDNSIIKSLLDVERSASPPSHDSGLLHTISKLPIL